MFGRGGESVDGVMTWDKKFVYAQLLAIECKAPGRKSKVTANQQAFLDAVQEHGGISIVADCLEDVQPYLDRAEVQ